MSLHATHDIAPDVPQEWGATMLRYARPRLRDTPVAGLEDFDRLLRALHEARLPERPDPDRLLSLGWECHQMGDTGARACVLAAVWCTSLLDYAAAHPNWAEAAGAETHWVMYLGLRDRAARAFGPRVPLPSPALKAGTRSVKLGHPSHGYTLGQFFECIASADLRPHQGAIPGLDSAAMRAGFLAFLTSMGLAVHLAAPPVARAQVEKNDEVDPARPEARVQEPNVVPASAAADTRPAVPQPSAPPPEPESPARPPTAGTTAVATPPTSSTEPSLGTHDWTPTVAPHLDHDEALTLDDEVMDRLAMLPSTEALRLTWGSWSVIARLSSPDGILLVITPPAQMPVAPAAPESAPRPVLDLSPERAAWDLPQDAPPSPGPTTVAPIIGGPTPHQPVRPPRRVSPGDLPDNLSIEIRFKRQ